MATKKTKTSGTTEFLRALVRLEKVRGILAEIEVSDPTNANLLYAFGQIRRVVGE